MRFLFFGDGAWAADSLERLLRKSRGAWTPAGVVLRRRPSGDDLERLAQERSLPILRPGNVNSPEFAEVVRSLRPDLNVSVSYDQIVRRPLLESAALGFLNFHAGLLPRYRGRNVVNWAILNGETEIGITAHFMDEGIDSGDLVLQRTLPIGWTDTYGTVLDRVVAAFPDLVEDAISVIAAGKATRTPQDHARATYFGGRGEGDEWLDWSASSRDLHNKIRGIARPGPGARTTVDGSPVVLWSAYWDPAWPSYAATPGQVVGRDREGSVVKTGDSVLLVKEIQEPGAAPRMPDWPIGARLGGGLVEAVRVLEQRVSDLERELSEAQGTAVEKPEGSR
jgi:methionyl-tRNA formyltransferase